MAMLTDLAYALRLLGRSPGFTAAVVLSLGLGIGANTAIFTLMDAVMWRMLPVQDPEHLLVAARQQGTDIGGGFNYADYKILRDADTMARSAGYATASVNVSVDGRPEASIEGHLVSGDYFSRLGVNPVIGRAIGPDDDRVPNGHPVVMLSHGYWERRFARDPGVLGRTIRLSDRPFTTVSVCRKTSVKHSNGIAKPRSRGSARRKRIWGSCTRMARVSRGTPPKPCSGGTRRPRKAARARSTIWRSLITMATVSSKTMSKRTSGSSSPRATRLTTGDRNTRCCTRRWR